MSPGIPKASLLVCTSPCKVRTYHWREIDIPTWKININESDSKGAKTFRSSVMLGHLLALLTYLLNNCAFQETWKASMTQCSQYLRTFLGAYFIFKATLWSWYLVCIAYSTDEEMKLNILSESTECISDKSRTCGWPAGPKLYFYSLCHVVHYCLLVGIEEGCDVHI